MRLLKYDGLELRFSEYDWKQLLSRFDAGKAVLNSLGYYYLCAGSICAIRNYRCSRCPFHNSYKKTNSCSYLLKKIIGTELFQHLFFFDTAVVWNPKHDNEVRKALQKVEDLLSGATKI